MNDVNATAFNIDDATQCFLGVDVGGTFTDMVFYTDAGEFLCVKVPSTPATPGLSTLIGLDEIRARVSVKPEVWAAMQHTHSSTVATNALIERTGANLGFITTAGFRDLLEIQRLATPRPTRYDSRRPLPLVCREMVRDVAERISFAGQILQRLDVVATVAAARDLRARGADLIVICFMHSYRNPAHEQQAKEAILSALPDVRVELSSEVWPQAREFERATLTCVNAFVRPVVENHVSLLTTGLAERGIQTTARAARSNGGMELLSSLAERPVVALLSGPAAGVAGAAATALAAGWENADLMTIDVGGTSADIGVVLGGRPVMSTEEHIADFPILIPSISVSAIGAGGGSVIWVDPAGSLKVGPRSVGADPGPACYGKGKAATPALTDAFLVAGFLAPGQMLGNKLELQMDPARKALQAVGDQIDWNAEQVADGAIRVATAMMAAETTNVLARHGVDLPQFSMVAYGGAGPLVAALLAEEVYIDRVLIPPTPGALSAFGAARADLEGDFVRPIYRQLESFDSLDMAAELGALRKVAEDWLKREASCLNLKHSRVEFSADMRYDGQGYDVTVRIDPDWLVLGKKSELKAEFHLAHKAAYGYNNQHSQVWLKELRAHVIGHLGKPLISARAAESIGKTASERLIRLRGAQVMARVVSRASLRGSGPLFGPAVIEQMDTTTIVPDGWKVEELESGAMVLSKGTLQ
jgi:N-methylhydantoinase A